MKFKYTQDAEEILYARLLKTNARRRNAAKNNEALEAIDVLDFLHGTHAAHEGILDGPSVKICELLVELVAAGVKFGGAEIVEVHYNDNADQLKKMDALCQKLSRNPQL
tara:strand:+ start:69 stop:395 length:327 start_codon:yes stop_codon:yes gene_type:complete